MRRALLLEQVRPGVGLAASAMLVLAQAAALRYDGSPHKNLFPPNGHDLTGIVLAAAALFVAAGGGIGGGALLVPIIILILRFQPNNAVALSNVTIVGGALANFAYNVHRRHPSDAKPLVDWDLILVMEPTTILGALLGSYINKLLPAWMTTVLLTVLLAFLSAKLITRGVKTYQAETRELQAAVVEPPCNSGGGGSGDATRGQLGGEVVCSWPRNGPVRRPRGAGISMDSVTSYVSASEFSHVFEAAVEAAEKLASQAAGVVEPLLHEDGPHQTGGGRGAMSEGGNAAGSSSPPHHSLEVRAMLEGESRQLPWQHLVILSLLTAAVIASDMTKTYVRCGSGVYWALVLALVPLTAVVSACAAVWLTRKYTAKVQAGLHLIKGEVAWTRRNTVVYPAVCSLAGLVAGMFGVGGGIVKGPLMLEMGVLPDVAAATSATMILFTAVSASAVYISFGTVKADYGIAMFVVGLAVTFLGQLAAQQLMDRLKRRSIVVFSMASLMSLAAAVMVVETIMRTLNAMHNGQLLAWGSVC